MNNDIAALAEESINLELNVSEIYYLFHSFFPVDENFWWQLVIEEKNHAALIKNGLEQFEPIGEFPHEILSDSLQDLKGTNKKLRSMLKQFKNITPSRELAFNTALEIEASAGELHFQNFIDKEARSTIAEIFQLLNREDKDHAERIYSYMKDNDISVQSERRMKLIS
jgi:ferritin